MKAHYEITDRHEKGFRVTPVIDGIEDKSGITWHQTLEEAQKYCRNSFNTRRKTPEFQEFIKNYKWRTQEIEI